MILLIDNYDSFVYNLARYIGELGREHRVERNDAVSVEDVQAIGPEAIVISPGPGRPDDAGVSLALVRRLGPVTPILGVCLGHQCVGQAYGGRVERAARPVHGKSAAVRHGGDGLFAGLPDPLRVGRYHSLIVEPAAGGALAVTARTDDGEVMALQHRHDPVYGVQFHPESVLTEHGHDLIANFIAAADRWREARP